MGQEYRLLKVINNNVVSAKDRREKEMVLMGKGIGFQKKQGDLIDPEKVEKKFSMPDEGRSRLEELFQEIPYEQMQAADQIIEVAKAELGRSLNKNIYVTLTDHLNFALTRHRQGIQIQNALLWEIQKFYQEEFRVGLQALSIIEKELGVRLPEDEAGFFALHIVNAEMDADMMQTIHVPEIIKDIMNIVCYTFQREPDSRSYVYERFVTHLKHFLQRAVKGEQYGTDDCEELNGMIRESFPKSYRCALRIKSYIKARMKYEVSLEEVTYLAIHLQKMEEK